MQSDDIAIAFINENAVTFSELSRDIWEHPQLGMEEAYAVKRQTEALDRAGFSIRVHDKYTNTALPSNSVDTGTPGVPTGGAQNIELSTGATEDILEQVAK